MSRVFSIELTPEQLLVLDGALGNAPYKVAAPLVQHINAEIQKALAAEKEASDEQL